MKNSTQKVFILGASGFLGSQCARYFKEKGYQVFIDRIDVTDRKAMEEAFSFSKPDVVINFAGVRAYPNIDWCEDHKEETVKVNVAGAINAMTAAIDCGAYPIQISSGCVYSGGIDHFFTEEDEPNFYGSFYSRTRIVLQRSLVELPVLYARIRMPISYEPHPRNTISKIISYSSVISVPNSVTLIEDFYPALEQLIGIKYVGILNMTNEGYIKHEDVLKAYKKIVNPEHKYKIITPDELEKNITKTGRSNCVLSMEKAKALGINMPAIDDNKLLEIMESFKSYNKV